jgi:hypothetical protein
LRILRTNHLLRHVRFTLQPHLHQHTPHHPSSI